MKTNTPKLEDLQHLIGLGNGTLDLRYQQHTGLPDGLNVPGDLELEGTLIEELPDDIKIGGSLNLSFSKIRKLPKGLVVPGFLSLADTSIEELPDNIKIGGNLVLFGSKIRKLPKGLVVSGNLDLTDTPIEELPDDIKIGGNLYLNGSKIRKLPKGLVVPGDLTLGYTPIEELPDDIKVGGDLYLDDSKILKLPDDITVCGEIFCDFEYDERNVTRLQDGTYIEGRYLYADGILTQVRKRRTVGKYTLYLGMIKGRNVISDGTHYAHCDKWRDGIADLLFKSAKDRGASQYKDLPLDTELTVSEMVAMYRVITGACKLGSETFVRSLGDLKDKYTIREAIAITKGQYNAKAFAGFFGVA